MIVLLKSENYFFLYSPKVRKIFIYRKTNQVVQKLGKKMYMRLFYNGKVHY